jgi:Tol biopolymer transport system component
VSIERMSCLRISRGPLKGTVILLALAGVLVVGLLAIQGRLFPKKPAINEIAFISDRDGRVDLWLMGVDGTNAHRVTSDTHAESSPSWSRNATKLVYTSDRSDITQVFTADAKGGRKPQQLTVASGVKLLPMFNPDGDRIAYIAQGRVYAMNDDGSNIEPVLPTEDGGLMPLEGGAFTDVDWSSDGKSMVGVQQVEDVQVPQILTEDSERAEIVADLQGRQLSGQKVYIKWSPVGRKLAVSMSAHNTGALVVIDYADQIVTVAAKGILPGHAAWSPSSDEIAFEILQYREGHGYSNKGLSVVNMDSLESKMIATGDISGPSWSSDGKLIIFTKTEKNGARGIWSVKPDGMGSRNLTAGKGNNYDAAASPALSGVANAGP